MDHSISAPVESAALRVVSLGAGVQSTVMLLMAARGEIGPMPNIAVFADTGWEPEGVYEHLEWLRREVFRLTNGRLLIYTTSAGNIREDNLSGISTHKSRFASMPMYTSGGDGMIRRQCTKEYKIAPIRKEVRRHLGIAPGKRVPRGMLVEQWIGISTDELQRLKESQDKWCKHRWPLIEARMSRADCKAWFAKHYPGRVLAKSACIGCPFRDNEGWRDMRAHDPASFEDACKFDDAIRDGPRAEGLKNKLYLHRSGVPLREADLDDPGIADLFQGECEGMCGV